MKIAHISDLHFFKMSYNPLTLLSKRLLGTLNQLFSRRILHDTAICTGFADYLEEQEVTHVIITGDVSTTSMKREFKTACKFIEELKKRGMEVFALPGNHDCYTWLSQYYKSFFYNFEGIVPFQSDENLPFHLDEDGVSAHKLRDGLWLVQIDTTHASAYFQATGVFKSGLEERLEKLLGRLPKKDKVILANHFPFFQNGAHHTRLIGGERLEKLLRGYPNVILYLHGHTHRQTLADMRNDDLPVVLDSGSLTLKKQSSWNLITFEKKRATIESIQNQEGTWTAARALEIPCR